MSEVNAEQKKIKLAKLKAAKAKAKLPSKGEVELKTKDVTRVLPVRYNGETIRIRHKEYEKLDVEKLPYESKIHIERAILAGDVIKK